MQILTNRALRFMVKEGKDILHWTCKGGFAIETAPDWIVHSQMFKSVAGTEILKVIEEAKTVDKTVEKMETVIKKKRDKEDESI